MNPNFVSLYAWIGMGNKCGILGHYVFLKRDWDSEITQALPTSTIEKIRKGNNVNCPVSCLNNHHVCFCVVSLTLQEGQLHVSLQVTSCHGHVIRLAALRSDSLNSIPPQHSVAPVFVDVSLIQITIELQFPYRNPETNGTGHDLRVDWIPKLAPLEHLHEIGMRLAVRASVSDAALPAGGEIPYPLLSHAHKFIIHIVFTICSHKNISYIYIFTYVSITYFTHTHKMNMSWTHPSAYCFEKKSGYSLK